MIIISTAAKWRLAWKELVYFLLNYIYTHWKNYINLVMWQSTVQWFYVTQVAHAPYLYSLFPALALIRLAAKAVVDQRRYNRLHLLPKGRQFLFVVRRRISSWWIGWYCSTITFMSGEGSIIKRSLQLSLTNNTASFLFKDTHSASFLGLPKR